MKFSNIKLSNSIQNELPADPILDNTRRQVEHACYSYVNPKKTKQPRSVHINKDLAKQFGFTGNEIESDEFLQLVTGNKTLNNFAPFAMCYGGHQFGHWAGQLGDGRAITIAEINHQSKTTFLQLKGSGETPYSRSADGLAVLRSSIREYLCSEAMFHLNIPTTRALSLSLSGDLVYRDMLYDGNGAYEKGAVVCRTSESFIRFGNFEIFAFRNDPIQLKKLVDYTIRKHFPDLGAPNKTTYLEFFRTVCDSTKTLIINWLRVGFVHGVMNTDNLSILGETIDFGPYGWLDNYDENWTPNTTDLKESRYRYGQQGHIGLWNLLKLANALYPLIKEAEPLENILKEYNDSFDREYHFMLQQKLGIEDLEINTLFIKECLQILQDSEIDMTIFFRELSKINNDNSSEECFNYIKLAFYSIETLPVELRNKWDNWFTDYLCYINQSKQTYQQRSELMNKQNPKYILRNYMSQMAIDLANTGDYSLINELYQVIQNPYAEQKEFEKWYAKRPDWAKNKPGCSQLSCSS